VTDRGGGNSPASKAVMGHELQRIKKAVNEIIVEILNYLTKLNITI